MARRISALRVRARICYGWGEYLHCRRIHSLHWTIARNILKNCWNFSWVSKFRINALWITLAKMDGVSEMRVISVSVSRDGQLFDYSFIFRDELHISGDFCEKPLSRCTQSICSGNGKCVESHPGETVCICNDSFRGRNCEVAVNYCDFEPCLYNGICTSEIGGYRCSCRPGISFVKIRK